MGPTPELRYLFPQIKIKSNQIKLSLPHLGITKTEKNRTKT